MTWKEFKDVLEQRGVKDDDEIGYIDISDDVTEVRFNNARQKRRVIVE